MAFPTMVTGEFIGRVVRVDYKLVFLVLKIVQLVLELILIMLNLYYFIFKIYLFFFYIINSFVSFSFFCFF